MNKRGVSPIVASILLILFTIVLFTIISKFSSNTVDKSLDKTGSILETYQNCNEISFNVRDAYCSSEKKGLLLVRVENEKDINFKDNFVVRLFDSNNNLDLGTFLYDTRLNAYELKDIAIARSTEKGKGILGEEVDMFKDIKKIEVIPKVETSNGVSFCQNLKKDVEVRDCIKEQA